MGDKGGETCAQLDHAEAEVEEGDRMRERGGERRREILSGHVRPSLAYTIAYRPCAPRPTDPVPRGLLTLCPAASSGPQGLYTVQLPDLATRLPPALTRSHPLPPARTRPTPLAILARRLLLVLVLFFLNLVEHVTHRGRPVHIEPLRRLEPVAIPKGCLCQKGWGGRAQG